MKQAQKGSVRGVFSLADCKDILRKRVSPRSPDRLLVRSRLARLTFAARYIRFAEGWVAHSSKRSTPKYFRTLRSLPRQVVDLLEAHAQGSPPSTLSQPLMDELAHSVAMSLYTSLASAYAKGQRRRSKKKITKKFKKRLTSCELQYHRLLSTSHALIVGGNPAKVGRLYGQALDIIQSDLLVLCEEAGAVGRANNTAALLANLRVCRLSRRYVMLAAAVLGLQAQLTQNRRRASLVRQARACHRLSRPFIELNQARRGLLRQSPGTVATIIGRIESVYWQERPRKPVSLIRLKGTGLEILVPYRSMPRNGIAPGMSLAVRGKVKESKAGKLFLESTTEGLRRFSKDYWEDRLADRVRKIYDLYPDSLAMDWDFADPASAPGRRARLTRFFV